MTAAEIADLIDRLKGHFALAAVGLSLVSSPTAERHLNEIGIVLDDPIQLRQRDSHDYHLPIRDAVELASHDPERQRAVLDAWLEMAILRIGDELGQQHYFDKAPVLIFLRRVRNGLAHGNKFDPQPPNAGAKTNGWQSLPARYGGLEITWESQGRVLGSGGLLKRGDALGLLDAVAAHLRTYSAGLGSKQ